MLSAVLTLRLDLPHTCPGYVSCVYSGFSLSQPRLPQARTIYLRVFIMELTGRQPQRQQRNKDTRLEKTNPDAAPGKRGNQMMNDDELILRQKSGKAKAMCRQPGEIELAGAAPRTLAHSRSASEEQRLSAGQRTGSAPREEEPSHATQHVPKPTRPAKYSLDFISIIQVKNRWILRGDSTV